MEYNLYGMGFVRFRKARFRGPLPARGRTQRAGWDTVPEVISYEEASTGTVQIQVNRLFCSMIFSCGNDVPVSETRLHSHAQSDR